MLLVMVVVAPLALCGPGAPGVSAHVMSPPEPYGINAGTLWPDGNHQLSTGLHVAAIAASGLRSVRAVAFWDQVEPQAPDSTGHHTFDWRRTDEIARQLAAHGLRWTPVLGYTTLWAGTLPSSMAQSGQPGSFTSFATAFARRYGRRGEFWQANPQLPYAPVTAYQVWNEPNVTAFWPPSPEPGRYADLYLATRSALLKVDPTARVAIGGLAMSGADAGADGAAFLRAMFAARPELRGQVDAVGTTIYPPGQPDEALARVARMRQTLDALGQRDTPIDIDEIGWSTSGTMPLTGLSAVSETLRAQYFGRLVALTTNADCGLGSVTPYAWVTAQDDSVDGAAWFGIADPATALLKPSGGAYVAAVDAAMHLPRTTWAICGRPDLPALVPSGLAAQRQPFQVTTTRACQKRRVTVGFTLGSEPEPYQRFEVTMPSGRRLTLDDPDGGGPAHAPTTVVGALPRAGGEARVVALDELGRSRADGTARVAPCRLRAARKARGAHPRARARR